MGSKWVELLKEINPRIARIAVMFDPATSLGGGQFYLRLVQCCVGLNHGNGGWLLFDFHRWRRLGRSFRS